MDAVTQKSILRLRAYMEAQHLNQKEIAVMIGVSENTLTNWMKGKNRISTENAKLIDKITADYKDSITFHSKEVQRPEGKSLLLPVISMASAATVNTAIYPIADWASDNYEDQQAFRLGKEGDIVLEVSGDSMLPWYPAHTRLLCRPCRPRVGDRVIAVLKDGEVIFKIYVEGKRKFGFKSINKEEGIELLYDKTDYSAVRDIYVVIESARDERALDTAMKNAGVCHFWEKELKELD